MTASPESGVVHIVDDEASVRDGLSLLVRSVGLPVIAYASGTEFLAADLDRGPACVLLDLRMPGMDGLAVQAALTAQGSRLPVIFLTAHGKVPQAVEAVQRGALGFLEKPNFDQDALIELIHAGLRRHRRALTEDAHRAARLQRIARLTEREREVARLAAAGRANKVIALDLGISERTVEIHRSRAMKKLELRSVADLVRIEEDLASAST